MKLRNKITGEIGYPYFQNWKVKSCTIVDENAIQIAKYTSLAELNNEWEDVPEKPKEYWFISTTGEVHRFEGEDKTYTPGRKQLGNQFSSREEAEKAVEKLKAWKRLKDKGFEFTNWEFRDVLDGDLVIEAKLNFDNASNIQRDLEVCFGGEE